MGSKGLWLGTGLRYDSDDAGCEQFSFDKSNDATVEKKFRGIAYSGKEITDRLVLADDNQVYDRLVIDVSQAGERTKKYRNNLSMSIFYNHDQNQIVGTGKLSFSNHIGIEGKFSAYTDKAKEIYGLMHDEGFPMQQSVYVETDHIEGISKGSVNVNGQEFHAPIAVFRNGCIREVSLCPIGADPNTHAEIFSVNQNNKGEKQMDMQKFTWLNQSQKDQYVELSKTDAFAAFEFAQKLCPCADAAAASAKTEEDEAKKKAEDDAKTASEESLKATEELKASKKELEELKSKSVELENKVKELESAKEQEVKSDPALFTKEHNKTGNVQLSEIIDRTKLLMKEKGLGYNQAYAQARAEAIKAA